MQIFSIFYLIDLALKEQTHQDQKQKIQEIHQLFQKFDTNQSGTLNLEEINSMFKSVGIDITIDEIQNLFIHQTQSEDKLGSQVGKFKKRKMTLKEFEEAMLSNRSYQKFKDLIKKLRKDIRHNDYEKVSADIIFLPTDLGEMLNFLYRKTVQTQIKKSLMQSIHDTESSIMAKRLMINQRNNPQHHQQHMNQDINNLSTQQQTKQHTELPHLNEMKRQQSNLDKNISESIQNFNELFKGQMRLQDNDNLYQKFQIPKEEIEFRREEKQK
ncbi:ef hand family protein [Stylonychia lemnae]|uniref:Ef hand family protein n=1 Tax=Stylonychia lemnae TaxID=5949 RepID=A0A078ASI7_STYLE|nr:ef hand family protein [Stylonychia lemnae]|eukprot:CDW83848.1 ef hand family protein [Stylonychia lemnae]